MRYNRKFLFGLLVLVVLLAACTQTPQQRAKDATVLIIAGSADGTVGSGSGFFVERDKIVTNIHVVADARMVFAVGTKKVYNIEKVTGYNPEHDLVVLKVSGKGKPLELSEGKKDEIISTVGYPDGGYKVTEGTVHGVRKSDGQLRLVTKGFPDIGGSVLAPGNSGGPVLNSEEKVIGIAVGGAEGFNFSYAIAASTLDELLKSDEEENLSDWQNRKPIRAYVYKVWGTKNLISENYEEAIKGFDKAIMLYPSAKFYEARGNTKSDSGFYQEAIQDYDKAIELISENVTAHYNRGNLKRKSGDYIGAIQDYDKALKLNPGHSSAYLNRGLAKAEMLDYTGAIEDYSEAIDNLNPQEPWKYYYNRGNAKLDIKDYAGAIEDYTEAINLKDDFIDAYLNRGVAKADRLAPDYAGAIEDYNEVIALNSEDGRAYNNRGNAKKARGQDEDAKQDHAAAYYYWGKADSNSGNYQAAINNFDKAIALVPNYVEVYHYRGDAYRLRGQKEDFQKAIADYDNVVALKPDYADIHVIYNNRGLAKAAINNYDEAIDDYTKAIGSKSNYAESHYNWGEVYRLRGQKDGFQKSVGNENFKEAEKNYNTAIQLRNFDFPAAYHKSGLVKEALGQTDAAKLDFAMAYYLWGNEAHKTKQYQKAIYNFNLFLEAVSDLPHAYDARGNAKMGLGKSKTDLGDLEDALQLYKEAIEDYNEAIKLDPEEAVYYRSRGVTKFRRAAIRDHKDHNGMIEDYESAIEDFEEAIKWAPDSTADIYELRGEARCLLGYAKETQGDSKEARKQYNLAREDFNQTITINPNNASYHRSLGLANAALGKAKAAIKAFEKTKQSETESEE